MTRKQYLEAVRKRRRLRRGKPPAEAQLTSVVACDCNYNYNRLFGAYLRYEQLREYIHCVEVCGGHWLAFAIHDEPLIGFVATADFCGGLPCKTDHHEAAESIVAFLRDLALKHPQQIRVLQHSRGWPLRELIPSAVA